MKHLEKYWNFLRSKKRMKTWLEEEKSFGTCAHCKVFLNKDTNGQTKEIFSPQDLSDALASQFPQKHNVQDIKLYRLVSKNAFIYENYIGFPFLGGILAAKLGDCKIVLFDLKQMSDWKEVHLSEFTATLLPAENDHIRQEELAVQYHLQDGEIIADRIIRKHRFLSFEPKTIWENDGLHTFKEVLNIAQTKWPFLI